LHITNGKIVTQSLDIIINGQPVNVKNRIRDLSIIKEKIQNKELRLKPEFLSYSGVE